MGGQDADEERGGESAVSNKRGGGVNVLRGKKKRSRVCAYTGKLHRKRKNQIKASANRVREKGSLGGQTEGVIQTLFSNAVLNDGDDTSGM